jgi:threonine dehydratase
VPTLDEIRQARQRIAAHIRRTPLVRSEWLSSVAGREVYLKLESLQVTHSFKARGAINAALIVAQRARTTVPETTPRIVTASAGNHGRAMAWASAIAGVELVVFTPRNAPRAKLDPIRHAGADLRADAENYEEAERMAKAFATADGLTFVSAYSHPDLLSAIGSIAFEILEELPGVGQVVVPVGGGGLVAGVAAAVKTMAPGVEVVGVEAEASHPFTASLAAGRIVEVEVGPTIADGLAGNMDPDNLAFPLVQAHVDRIVLAPESSLRAGICSLLRHDHLVAEGAGIAAVAALTRGLHARRGPTVAIVSGANIDIETLKELL